MREVWEGIAPDVEAKQRADERLAAIVAILKELKNHGSEERINEVLMLWEEIVNRDHD